MAHLPEDIWYIICTMLWHQRDFNTLSKCACSGKQLAAIAVMYLYRNMPDETHTQLTMGRTLRWRTVLLSTLGKTLYPYSKYIRALNLRDLQELLAESKWGDSTYNVLFQGELEQFAVLAINKMHTELCAMDTTNAIGEAITKQTPLLEVLVGKVRSGVLSRWIPRLPRLTHLKPFFDTAFNENGTLIRLHCPSFKGLDIDDWNGSNSDEGLVAFLNELRPQSLESFKISGHMIVGSKSFQALSCHGKSLVELKLRRLTPTGIHELSLLKDCTNLVSLSFADNGRYKADLGKSYSDALLEAVSWLKKCTKLKNLACTYFTSAPSLVPLLLSENSIHLTSLKLKGSVRMEDQSVHPQFYEGLANQTSLQTLSLEGDLIWNALDAEDMLKSLGKLANLTNLCLGEAAGSFDDQHIVQLVSSLPKLEVCSMSGYGLTDAIWDEFGSLKSLRKLELDDLTDTSKHGILKFIEKLGPGNKGLVLSLTNVNVDSDFFRDAWDGVGMIQETIAKKLKGRFELTLDQDSEIDEIFGDDDQDEDEDGFDYGGLYH